MPVCLADKEIERPPDSVTLQQLAFQCLSFTDRLNLECELAIID